MQKVQKDTKFHTLELLSAFLYIEHIFLSISATGNIQGISYWSIKFIGQFLSCLLLKKDLKKTLCFFPQMC